MKSLPIRAVLDHEIGVLFSTHRPRGSVGHPCSDPWILDDFMQRARTYLGWDLPQGCRMPVAVVLVVLRLLLLLLTPSGHRRPSILQQEQISERRAVARREAVIGCVAHDLPC